MIGESVTEKQLQDMLNLADVDKDGKINYEGEFDMSGGGNLTNKRSFIDKKKSSYYCRVCEVAVVTRV